MGKTHASSETDNINTVSRQTEEVNEEALLSSTSSQGLRKSSVDLDSSDPISTDVNETSIEMNEVNITKGPSDKDEVNTSKLHKLMKEGLNVPIKIDNLDTVGYIDSGANHSFADRQYMSKNNMLSNMIAEKTAVTLGNKQSENTIGYVKITMTAFNKTRTMKLYIVENLAHPIILGRLWLYTYNPQIDWKEMVTAFELGDGVTRSRMKPMSRRAQSKLIEDYQSGATRFEVIELNEIHKQETTVQQSSDTFQGQLKVLLEKYKDVMTDDLPKRLPPQRPIDHRIELSNETAYPFKSTYRLSIVEMQALKTIISDMLEKKWIRPSTSPYGAPVMLVSKKDGKYRMVVDYRQLNNLTIKNRYPLPRQDEMMAQLHGAKIFSKLDLKSGYYQIRMHPKDIHKTAFNTRWGHYEFMVLPQGLTGSPGTFMGVMNTVFKEQTNVFVIVFMDDIMIYSKNEEDHLKHIEEVFQILHKNELYVAPDKCEFGKTELEFLGHVVTQNGLKMNAHKTKAISEWGVPKNLNELRSFIGMCTYYRQFIPGFSQKMAPLSVLTKSENHDHRGNFEWKAEQQKAFDNIKQIMISDLVLRIPDPEKPFILFFDAAGSDGIGGVLCQEAEDGKIHPVAFESRKLLPAETRYPTHEQEQAAFVHCLKKWRWYLDAQPFTVYTDNYSTSFIKTQGTLSGRQARWLDILQSYSYTIKHLPREKNVVSDALSKRPYLVTKTLDENVIDTTINDPPEITFDTVQDIDSELYNLEVVHIEDGVQEQFLKAVSDDPVLVKLQQDILTGAKSYRGHRNLENFRCEDGRIYYNHPSDKLRSRLYIPKAGDWRDKVLREAHDSKQAGHLGDNKTVQRIAKFFYWPNMNREIKQYVKECPQCQLNKHHTDLPSGLLKPLPVPDRPGRDYAIDFMVGLPESEGNTAALVMVDRFSKRIRIRACKGGITAIETANIIVQELFRNNGTINSIVSDRDSKFTSDFWKEYFGILDVQLKMTTARHQQANGQSERAIQTIKTMLRHYINVKQTDWVKQLPLVEFAYNTSIQKSTGKTPFEIETGETPPNTLVQALMPSTSKVANANEVVWKEIASRLNKVRDTMMRQTNKKRKDVQFEVGDIVKLSATEITPPNAQLIQSLKLGPKWYGPLEVLERVGDVCYKLKLPRGSKGHPVFDVEKLQKYYVSTNVRQSPPEPEPIIIEGEKEYKVEEILTHKKVRGALYWLVKWTGLSTHENSWEAYVDLVDVNGVINDKLLEYCNKHPCQDFEELDLIKKISSKRPKTDKIEKSSKRTSKRQSS